MANPTRFGDAGPVFGLVAENSGFVQDYSQKRAFDKATAEDNLGNVVTVSYYNGRYEGSITLIDKQGATLPSVLTAVLLANLDGPAKVIIEEKESKPEQKGYKKHTFTFIAFDGITL